MSNNNSNLTLEQRNNIALMHFLAEGGDIDDYVPLTLADILPIEASNSSTPNVNHTSVVTQGNLADLWDEPINVAINPLQNNTELALINAAPIPTYSPQLKNADNVPILSPNTPLNNLPFALKDVPYESLPSLCGYILENRDSIPNISYYNSADDEQGIICQQFLKFWDALEQEVIKYTFSLLVPGRHEISFIRFCQMIYTIPEGMNVFRVYSQLLSLPAKWKEEDKARKVVKGPTVKVSKSRSKYSDSVRALIEEKDLKMAELDLEVKENYFKFIESTKRKNAYKQEMMAKIANAKMSEKGGTNET